MNTSRPIKPIIYWRKRYRWTIGPIILIFLVLPFAILDAIMRTASALWDTICLDICGIVQESTQSVLLIAAGIIFGDPEESQPKQP